MKIQYFFENILFLVLKIVDKDSLVQIKKIDLSKLDLSEIQV